MPWFVYLLETSDGTYYCGISTDVRRRVAAHNSGHASCRYTSGRRPVKLVAKSPPFPSQARAAARERLIKKLPAHRKIGAVMDGRRGG